MSETVRRSADGNEARHFVSVIVPHFDDLDALGLCLAGLRRQTWPPERCEVIVADNNSSCGLDAVRTLAAGFVVIHAPVQGAGPARNAAVEVARGDVLAFIDSDCQPTPEWIERGVASLSEHDFVGGQVRVVPHDERAVTQVEAWEMEFGFDFERYVREGYTGSGNMWVWRNVFDTVGGFRSGVSEDMDWSFRARKAGFRLGYEPRAVVSHYARRDWTELERRWTRVVREHHLLTLERSFGALRWAGWTAAMPVSALPHLVRVACSKRLPTPALKFAAMRVLVRHRLWRTRLMWRMAHGRETPVLSPDSASASA